MEIFAICAKRLFYTYSLSPPPLFHSLSFSVSYSLSQWIENGYNGEMGFLAREDRMARRRDLSQVRDATHSYV